MAFHKDLGDDQIHRIYDKSYTNNTQRDNDTAWNGLAINIGKTVFVSTTNSVFMLLSTSPSWFAFGGAVSTPDTIYTADGTVLTSRTIAVPSGRSLAFNTYNLTPTTFTQGADLEMVTGQIDIEAKTGDGFGGTLAISRFLINTTVMQILDQINGKGLVYGTDYSAAGGLDPRWIPDKAWVEAHTGGGSIYSTSGTLPAAATRTVDGLTAATLAFRMPDTTLATYVAMSEVDVSPASGASLIHTVGNGAGGMLSQRIIACTPVGMLVTDTTALKGLEYVTDYSAAWTARSLVDKAYSDAGSFYRSNGVFPAGFSRTAEGFSNASLLFRFFDTGSPATFLKRSLFQIENNSTGFEISQGDGAGNPTTVRSIYIVDATGMVITDTTGLKGVDYAADYSANYTPRTLTDKGYVDSRDLNTSFSSELSGLRPIFNIENQVFLEWDSDNWLVKLRTGNLNGNDLRVHYVIVREGVNNDTVASPNTNLLDLRGEFFMLQNTSIFLTADTLLNTSLDLTDGNQEYTIFLSVFGSNAEVAPKNVRMTVTSRGNTEAGGVDVRWAIRDSTLADTSMSYYQRFDSALYGSPVLTSPFKTLSSMTLSSGTGGALPTVGNADATGGTNAITFSNATEQRARFDNVASQIGGATTFDFYVNWTNFSSVNGRVFAFNNNPLTNDIEIKHPVATTNFQYFAEPSGAVELSGFWVAGVWTRVTVNHFTDVAGKVHVYKDGVLVFDENGITAAGTGLGIAVVSNTISGPIPNVARFNGVLAYDGAAVSPVGYANLSLSKFRIFNKIFTP